jgi:DNA-binding transcriptional MerR regulator
MLNIGEFSRLGQVSPRMLRHYDETGLIKPVLVDPQTGYRFYEVAQLGRLHRLVALRDLGFSLEQARPILDDDLSLEQLRGMLRMRQAQIEVGLVEEEARLRRVEAHLRAIEGSQTVQIHDVVVKQTDPIRIAEAVGTAPGHGYENLGPVFAELLPEVYEHLRLAGARPGISVAHYEGQADDGSLVLHAGFQIAGQAVTGSNTVSVVELPQVRVASVVHHGSMETFGPTYEALIRWIEDSGHQALGRSRELYHEWHEEDPSRHVTELQMPIA